MNETLDPELERRIAAMERGEDQGAGFTARDWAWLLLTGVALPVVLLLWGWF